MKKFLTFGFWDTVARLILRNRLVILLVILVATVFLATKWKDMRFSYTEANLLPENHPVNIEYQHFIDRFGEEGNLIVLGVQDSSLFTPEILNQWNSLSDSLNSYPEVALSVSLQDLKLLKREEDPKRFDFKPYIDKKVNSLNEAQ
ncbi:MAG: RND family transporter, partial [Leeuwenhoekiella sp.]